MKALFRSLLTAALCISTWGAAPLLAWASETEQTFTPKVGQLGKDVVWVPTSQALVDKMLDMAELRPDDFLVDLGSGDGRTVITAAQRGATAKGIEYNPDMVEFARKAAKDAGVTDRVTFEQGDIFQSDFSQATVVTLFLTSSLNLKLRPILLDMKPGTRVVSNSFNMGDWTPDESTRVSQEDGCVSFCDAYKWIVPAKVAGTWQFNERDLVLNQTYQTFEGVLHDTRKVSATDDMISPVEGTAVTHGKLDGERIQFSIGNDRYMGEVHGNRMQGTVNGKTQWVAERNP